MFFFLFINFVRVNKLLSVVLKRRLYHVVSYIGKKNFFLVWKELMRGTVLVDCPFLRDKLKKELY